MCLIAFLLISWPASNWGSAKKCSPHPEGSTGLDFIGGLMIPYQFKDKIDDVGFFRFDKKWVKNKHWALLPMASKAVLPVIGCHCDANGHAFPGERRTAILSGLSDKTVRKGIQGLKSLPGFRFESYVSSRLKKSKKFFLELPPPLGKGRFFPFHKFILESGLWRELSTVAKAVYPVLRTFGWFDYDEYCDSKEDNDYPDVKIVFENREYDFFDGDLTYIADYAGIHRNSLKAALSNLKAEQLIEEYTDIEGGFKLFLRSKNRIFYKRRFLNDKILNSYRHLHKASNNAVLHSDI